MELPLADRGAAGRALARALPAALGRGDPLVLALPRGGVPVAFEIARHLGAELDLLPVRKLGAPDQPDLALGAIAGGGIRVLNRRLIEALGVPERVLTLIEKEEARELARRQRRDRGDRAPPRLRARRVVLVDDGAATGATMRAALAALGSADPAWVAVALPVAPAETVEKLRLGADRVVCLATPEPFHGVAHWYRAYPRVTDDEAQTLLQSGTPPAAPLPEGS